MITPLRRSVLAAMVAILAGAPATALGQSTVTVKGMITHRDGERLTLNTGAGEQAVTIRDTTKIESVAGALGVRRESRAPSDLIRGLAVEVTGTQAGSELIASSITFKPGDLKTARQIQAGLQGTEERLANIGELVAVGREKVFFATGSATLSEKAKQDLQALAARAKTYKGYRLAVVGRADTTGSAGANQRLSEARAAAVTAFLLQSCGVLPGSILPQTALGDAPVLADPDPPKTNAEARRVTVTIAVSKATLPS